MEELSNEELKKRVEFYEKRYGPYIEKRGLHNWKNLFRKPNMYEWIILGMIILSFFMYWTYSVDVDNSFTNGYNTCIYEKSNLLLNPSPPNQSLTNQGGNNNVTERG